MYRLGVYTAQNKVKVLDEKHKQVSDNTWTPHEAAKILLEWERDRADLLTWLRELCKIRVTITLEKREAEAIQGARDFLSRLEKGERP